MATFSKISMDIFPKPEIIFSPRHDLEDPLQMYQLIIINNDFKDEELEYFIIKNTAIFKKLDVFFVTKFLFKVVNKGYIKTLKVILLNELINIDVQDMFNNTILMVASELGHFEIVSLLLEKKASLNIQNEVGKTALMFAAESGRQKIVAILCQNNADVNALDINCNTAMMLASRSGHKNSVLELIKHGANLDIQNDKGDTALMLSAKEGFKHIVLALINKGANKDLQNKKGHTALTTISITKKSIDIIDLLIRKMGMSINIYDLENISSISSYANKLIKKLSKLTKEQSQTSNALVFFPTLDLNGAFTIHQRIYIVKTLEEYYNVKIKHPTSAEDIRRFLEKREYKVLFISGHGSPENIILSEGFSISRRNIQIFSSMRASKNAIVVLNSCSTGGQNGGIAKLIANITKIRTFAPKEEFNHFTMELKKDDFRVGFYLNSRIVFTRITDPEIESKAITNEEETRGTKKRKRNSVIKDLFDSFLNL